MDRPESMAVLEVLTVHKELEKPQVCRGVVECHSKDPVHLQFPLVGEEADEGLVHCLCSVRARQVLEADEDLLLLPLLGDEVGCRGLESKVA